MRSLLIALTIALLACTAAFADDKKERPRCELCGMFWDISTTRITAEFKGVGSHKFESVGCMYQSVGSKADVTKFKIVDYATASGKSPKIIDGKTAHYLYGTERLKGSMAPFTAAFASKDAALKAQKELGGDYMTYDTLWKKLDGTLKKKTAVKGMTCACGDAKCKGCDKTKAAGCSCPGCATK